MIQLSKHGPSLGRIVKNAAIALLIAGCVSSGPKVSSPILGGTDNAGNKIYFSGTRDQIMKTLENYSKTYDVSTVESQIDYLLYRLQSTHYKLERNGSPHTPPEAAQFLRWKMARPRWQGKVNSAQDFVTVICAGSVMSGEPYVATLPDSSRHNMEAIFQNELDLLTEFQKEKEMPTALPQQPAASAPSAS